MYAINAMREIPTTAHYRKGDVLVLFGELFTRGYANGIVEEAEKIGMKIIYSTVGRRGTDGLLRPLNAEEVAQSPTPLINVPLEAGFDLEPSSKGLSPADQLKGIKMDEWAKATLDWQQVEESKQAGHARLQKNVDEYMRQLAPYLTPGANVLFVHTMAGGVPRAKIFMPTMNKVFKGRGERFESSQEFLDSDMGRFAMQNFDEVTADTFKILIESSAQLRDKIEKAGGRVRYLAYGYHGCEVLIQGSYRWQTYTPYFQGWAKMRLENWARDFWNQDIHCAVYNCPEILTNSSSIFQGVEVSLYPLLGSLQKEGEESKYVQGVLSNCAQLLKSECKIHNVLAFTDRYLTSNTVQNYSNYSEWPEHNGKEQMELMLSSSDELIGMHLNPKQLMTAVLSEEVFKATGSLMLQDSWEVPHPVVWLGHDIIARQLARNP